MLVSKMLKAGRIGLPISLLLLGCAGCGRPETLDAVSLEGSINGEYMVDADTSYSVRFECLISEARNSTWIGEGLVPLGDVDLVRNPAKTLDSALLAEVESARIVANEFKTWLWLDDLKEVEVESKRWNQARVRASTREQLWQRLREEHATSKGGTLRHALTKEFARAKVVEYRYEGVFTFRIPSSLTARLNSGVAPTGGHRVVLPFIFSSPDLPGEGAALLIKAGGNESGRFTVQVSVGQYCDRFKDRRVWD